VANLPDTPDDVSDEAPAIAGGSEAPAAPADPSAEKVIRTLEELRKRDPNRYVRLRSAAALRQIGPREVQ
jgi:hypothetical protein